MGIKITHKSITLDLMSSLFKTGSSESKVVEGKLWDGCFLIHSELDNKLRLLHLYYFDPINGTEVPEGYDITTVEETMTVFKRIENKED